ncbi:MAG: hypothetical protein K6T85_14515 [Gorillibacterium sp.]|nr:hypothetical protein [Gorillibacterium sp.]
MLTKLQQTADYLATESNFVLARAEAAGIKPHNYAYLTLIKSQLISIDAHATVIMQTDALSEENYAAIQGSIFDTVVRMKVIAEQLHVCGSVDASFQSRLNRKILSAYSAFVDIARAQDKGPVKHQKRIRLERAVVQNLSKLGRLTGDVEERRIREKTLILAA